MLNVCMDLKSSMTNIIIIESPQIYRETVYDLITSVMENNDNWIFSHGEKVLKKSTDIEIINSLFSISFDNRKIQKAVVDNMYDIAVNESYFEKTQELMTRLEAYCYELEWELGYNINVDFTDFRDVIKSGVKGLIVSEDYLGQLSEYIKISARLLKNKLIILAGVQESFSEEEWKQIEETAVYEEIYLLCVEHRECFSSGNKIIIDEDGCRIV